FYADCRKPPCRSPKEGVAVHAKLRRHTQKGELLLAFLAYLRSERGLSESTIEGYTRHLTQFLESLGPRKGLTKTTRQDVHHFLASLDPALSSSTKAHYFSALRQLCRFMQLDYNMRRDPMLGLRSPRQWRTLPRVLSAEEAVKLIEQPGAHSDQYISDALNLRDRAMLELFFASGIRLS